MVIFPPHTQWDIFCKVIDNYGDIGVCWRLARQLAREHLQNIRLWVDDLSVFATLCPLINPELPQQMVDHIAIHHWSDSWQAILPADIVIEAFACNLPADYIQAMSKASKTIFWVNLEYLTYEHWASEFHATPSLQPFLLKKYFFFPGLAEAGGTIREQGVIEQAISFQNDMLAQQQFLSQLNVIKRPDAMLMLIFSYANKALGDWLEALKQSEQSYHLLIPQTPLLNNIADYLKHDVSKLVPPYTKQLNNLTLQIIPFVNQPDFDKLLWCMDYNLVRGEDSFVRAQYAGKPMLWHIYPQQEEAHLAKLEAFLDYYLKGLPITTQQAIKLWWLAWNNQENLAEKWLAFDKHLSEIKAHSQNWAKKQKTVTDLITKLGKLYKN